jgi:hypothetical protein
MLYKYLMTLSHCSLLKLVIHIYFSVLSYCIIFDVIVSLQSIEGAIGGNSYQHNKVNQWTSNVVEQCLNQLTKLGKPFKYIGKNKLLDYTIQICFSLNSMVSIILVRSNYYSS